MGSSKKPLPQWTWEDLEAALDEFTLAGAGEPLRAHLMRGLEDDSVNSSPRELLQQVLSAGWVMAQVGAQSGASATVPRHAAGGVAS